MRATKLMVAFVIIALVVVLVGARWMSTNLVSARDTYRSPERNVRQLEEELSGHSR
jgi:hypothetical protein